ncbi:MAG TPA: hypothetical protein VFO34_14055 [Candidatus Acidoferrales bacterium]|nr:hypothetical protein [Candidatus Acidoferrales bacterium]
MTTWRVAVALLCVAAIFASAQSVSAQQPLGFFKNYFVTGDYTVSGVGLRGTGDSSGFATNTIQAPSPAIPANADIVAAFLYWQTVEKSKSTFAGKRGFFNGHAIIGFILGNPNAPVSWSAGGCAGSSKGTTTLRTYRADVRPFLNVLNGSPQGNLNYQVKLVDSGSGGGGTPLTLGATLVIIYRVISPNVPLKGITIYDGSFAPSNTAQAMTQPLQGFYDAAVSPIAEITQIVGNGQANKSEQVFLNGVSLPSLYPGLPPFPGSLNGSWDNPTWTNVDQYGTAVQPVVKAHDSIATSLVQPAGTNSGCVSWGAVIFGTTVQNQNNDGLLDVWKTNHGYMDVGSGNFVNLPDSVLGEKDLYVQIDYLASHDFITSNGAKGHSHVPKQAAIDMVGNAFLAKGIHLHVDCGANCYPPIAGGIPDPFIISGGSGGNVIDENSIACQDSPGGNPPFYCGFPGQIVTSWKGGFEFFKQRTNGKNVPDFQLGRDDSYHYVLFAHALGLGSTIFSVSGGTLSSISVADMTATVTTSVPHGLSTGTRITVGGANSPNPIFGQDFALNGTYPSITVPANSTTTFTFPVSANVPAGVYNADNNPGMFVSTGPALSTSGWSDFGGADSIITLGLWRSDVPGDDQVGSDLVQAGTLMHEIGHTLALQHGGGDGVNCKPNFQSIMNYLFQVRGLIDAKGVAHVDYSHQALDPLSESSLNDNTGIGGLVADNGAGPYGTRWYAPLNPLDNIINSLGGRAATRHCDGTAIGPNEIPMVRLDGPPGAGAPLDWNNDGMQVLNPAVDINFNGTVGDPAFTGYDDWSNLDLRQIGARRGVFGFSGGVWGANVIDPQGTLEDGAGGTLEDGAGGTLEDGAGGTLDDGAGGTLDDGAGGTLDDGAGGLEGDFTRANATVDPPFVLNATQVSHTVVVNWSPPGFGQIRTYYVWRAVLPVGVLPGALPASAWTNIGKVTGAPPLGTFTDKNVKNGTTYAYFVTAALGADSGANNGNQSGASNFVTVPVKF